MKKTLMLVILLLPLFNMNYAYPQTNELGAQVYEAGYEIGHFFGQVILWVIIFAIIAITTIIIILRWVFRINFRSNRLENISQELTKLNGLNNDIRILLDSIDKSLKPKHLE